MVFSLALGHVVESFCGGKVFLLHLLRNVPASWGWTAFWQIQPPYWQKLGFCRKGGEIWARHPVETKNRAVLLCKMCSLASTT